MFHLLFLEAPAALRRDSRLFVLAILVFFLSILSAFILAHLHTDAVFLIYNTQQVADFNKMFHPQWQHMIIEQRSNTEQFIFYVSNNTWVGFELFLLGILLGAGTLFFLGYTGFTLGLMMGYLSATGHHDTLWPVIITHSSFEILATLIAAVAGMKWGFSLILLGDPLRRHEFGMRFAQSVMLMINATVFFIIAALIEAYWSSGYITSASVKYMTGIASWTLLIFYLLFVGRTASR